MSQRLKGQEVEILLIVNSQPRANITAVRDFEMTPDLEILSEGYLGETTDRKDSVYKGVTGKLTVHPDNQDILKLMQDVVDKARRRTPGTKINIKATLNFPNGQRPRVIIPDAEFGGFPLSVGGRAEFTSVGLTFQASEFRVIY